MAFILLEDWAKKHNVSPTMAKNWARRQFKKSGAVKLKMVMTKRYVIEETTIPIPKQKKAE